MNVIPELLKMVALAAVIGSAAGLVILFLDRLLRKPLIKETLKIKKTIVPFEYTGKDYNEWMQYIAYMNGLNDVMQDRDTQVNRELTARLEAENIFKINK